MFAAGGEWRSIDVSDAADQFHIDKGNEFLENGWVDANYLDTSDVLFLTQKFRGLAFPDEPVVPFTTAFACQLWPANSCIPTILLEYLHLGGLDTCVRESQQASISLYN